jgi:signal transduction histidine kinase
LQDREEDADASRLRMASAHENALRIAYEAETLAQCRTGARMACKLAFLFVPAFALGDVLAGGALDASRLQPRIACLVGVAVVLRLLRTPFGARHPRGLALTVAGLLGLLVDWVVLENGGGTSPRYAGLNLVGLAGSLLMPWGIRGVLVGAAVLNGGYVATILGAGRIGDGHVFANHLTYLFGTTGICLVAAKLREQLRWREFRSRVALADALRLQGEFTAKMSHEIRTPINVMIGYADILLDGAIEEAGPERRRLVERVREHGVKLRTLVSDLLDYAKADAGKLAVRPEPVSARDVVEEVADSFRPLAERKGIRVDTEYVETGLDLVTDPHRLGQILVNLVSNAVKFTEKGSVRLSVRRVSAGEPALAGCRMLTGDNALDADGVLMLVEDTGIGVREDDLARLADDYIQFEGERYGGTGLGLSIARKLTQLLGGRLAVRSMLGEGSTFAVVLPASKPALREAA